MIAFQLTRPAELQPGAVVVLPDAEHQTVPKGAPRLTVAAVEQHGNGQVRLSFTEPDAEPFEGGPDAVVWSR